MAEQQAPGERPARTRTVFDSEPQSQRSFCGFRFLTAEEGTRSGYIAPEDFMRNHLPNLCSVTFENASDDHPEGQPTYAAYLSTQLDLDFREVRTAMPAQFAKLVARAPGIGVEKSSWVEGHERVGLYYNNADFDRGARLRWYRSQDVATFQDAQEVGRWNDRGVWRVGDIQAGATLCIRRNCVPMGELGSEFLPWLEQTFNDFIHETHLVRRNFLQMKEEYERAQRLVRRYPTTKIPDDTPLPVRRIETWLDEVTSDPTDSEQASGQQVDDIEEKLPGSNNIRQPGFDTLEDDMRSRSRRRNTHRRSAAAANSADESSERPGKRHKLSTGTTSEFQGNPGHVPPPRARSKGGRRNRRAPTEAARRPTEAEPRQDNEEVEAPARDRTQGRYELRSNPKAKIIRD